MNDRKAIPEENFNYYYNKTLNNQVVEHIELPSNFVQKYHYLNINNPSFYDVYLYSANPDQITFIKPFAIVKQNTLQSVEIPTDITTNGIFLYPVYNPNNSVQYSKNIIISFSTKSNYWNTEEILQKTLNLKNIFYSDSKESRFFDEYVEMNLRGVTPSKVNFPVSVSNPTLKVLMEFYLDSIPAGIDINDISVETGTGEQIIYPVNLGFNSNVFEINSTNTYFMFKESNSANVNIIVRNLKFIIL